MAMNINPVFTKEPILASVVLTAAATQRDSTATRTTLYTATADGILAVKIRFIGSTAAVGTPSAKVGRVFIDGTLWDEVAIPATVSSNTAVGPKVEITMDIPLAAAQVISVSISVYAGAQDATAVHLVGGKYAA